VSNARVGRSFSRASRRATLSALVILGSLSAGASAAAGESAEREDFETVPDRSPAQLLPPAMVAGTNFHIADPVHGDGLMNRFVIESRFGKFDAYGRAALAVRIHEVAALTELSKVSPVELVAGGVEHGVESQVRTATGVVTHPIATITGIPKGVVHLFSGYQAKGEEAVSEAGRLASSGGGDGRSGGSGARSALDKGTSAAQGYAEQYLGITGAERAWYKRLGVDPYTNNTVLRDAIRKDAKIEAAAGFGVKFLGIPQIPGIGLTQQAVDAIYNEDPAVLRKRTREALAGYGLSPAEIESFMNGPLLSPTRQVLLLSLVKQLDGVAGRVELFRHSIGLTSDEEFQVYLRSVGLLVEAHRSRPVASVVPGVRLPAALRADGGLVVCGAFEAVYWTDGVADAEEALRKALPALPPGMPREVWIAGTISDRARAVLERRGWQLHEVPDTSAPARS